MTRTAVVLLSGGIDSAVCMGLACREYDCIIPVHVQYGQQTDGIEMGMAYNQLTHLSSEYPETFVEGLRTVDYSDVFQWFAEGVANPDKDFGDMVEDDGRSTGYVPMRNLHLIATAAGFADRHDAEAIYLGAQGGDEDDYPDCRPGFIDKAAGAISKSLPDEQSLNLMTPLISKSKPEVIELGDEVGVDFAATYSCYSEATDPENPEPCGNCPACVERAEAFDAAGIADPHQTEVTPNASDT